MKGITTSGFHFDVEDKRFNDMVLMEMLVDMQRGDLTALPKILDRLLGKEQKAALYEHLEDEDGIVPVDKVSQEIMDIFNAKKEAKN